jgi:hypothetical protein
MPNLDPISFLKGSKKLLNREVMIALRWCSLMLNSITLDLSNAENINQDGWTEIANTKFGANITDILLNKTNIDNQDLALFIKNKGF